ncbi:tetratricopeptide repeat protein, partial [Arthrospira platensis SPKY1]|nr:tetratricopeptide repeat protein [Arthrospira platensis SPKY1]
KMGTAYRNLGQTERALECFNNAVTIEPSGQNEAWFDIGKLYYAQEDFERAVEALQKGAKSENDDFAHWLGVSHAQLGQYEEAKNFLLKFIRKRPDDYEAWFNLGVTYSRLSDFENTVICLKESVKFQ